MHELTLINNHPLFNLISVNSCELRVEVISDASVAIGILRKKFDTQLVKGQRVPKHADVQHTIRRFGEARPTCGAD